MSQLNLEEGKKGISQSEKKQFPILNSTLTPLAMRIVESQQQSATKQELEGEYSNIRFVQKHPIFRADKGSVDMGSKKIITKNTLQDSMKKVSEDDLRKVKKFYRDDTALIDELKSSSTPNQQNQISSKTLIPKDPKLQIQNYQKMKQQQSVDNLGSRGINRIKQGEIQRINKTVTKKLSKIGILQSQDISYLQDQNKNIDQVIGQDFPELTLMLRNKNQLSTQQLDPYEQTINNRSSLPQLNQTQAFESKKNYFPSSLNQIQKVIRSKNDSSQNITPTKLPLKLHSTSTLSQPNLFEDQAQNDLERFFAANSELGHDFFKNNYIKSTLKNSNYEFKFQQSDKFLDEFLQDVFKGFKGKYKGDQTDVFGPIKDQKKFPIQGSNPTGRKEAQLLQYWLDLMIKTYVKEGQTWEMLTLKEKEIAISNIKTIIKVTVQEIIRQVSVLCQERGDIIQKVFDLTTSIISQDYNLLQNKYVEMEKKYEERIKALEKEELQLFLKSQNDLDQLNSKLVEEISKRDSEKETVDLLKLKLESQIDKNILMMKDNRERNQEIMRQKEIIQELELKLQKFKDKKRAFEKKFNEISAKEQQQAKEQFEIMRKLSITNPSLVNNFYGNASKGNLAQAAELSFNNDSEDLENLQDEVQSPLSPGQADGRKSRNKRNVSDSKSQSQTQLKGPFESLEMQEQENQKINEAELENFDYLREDRDDMSLDSMQLISKDDDNMHNPNFDQDEDEANFVRKEILLKKFEQEMQISQDFEKLLSKSEDVYNQVTKTSQFSYLMQQLSSIKDKKGNYCKFNIIGLFKEIISTMFKDELKFLTQLCMKFSKLKNSTLDQIELGLGTSGRNIQDRIFFEINSEGEDIIQKVEGVKVKHGETQTDFIDFYNTLEVGINIPELYKFDKKAFKLTKMSIESDYQKIIIKQQEYLAKNAQAWMPFLPNYVNKQNPPLNTERVNISRGNPQLFLQPQPIRSRGHSREQSSNQNKRKANSPSPNRNEIVTTKSPSKVPKISIKDKLPQPQFQRKSTQIFDIHGTEAQRTAHRILSERNRKIDDFMKHEESIKQFNQTIQSLLKKIQEYESEIDLLSNKKSQLSLELKLRPSALTFEDRAYQDIFNNAYQIGFQRGLAHGFFKGATENQQIFIQKGMHEGIREGWLSGFDDGAEYGIKKVFKEAFMKGIDLSILDIKEYLDMNKLKREKLNEYEKIFNQIEYSDKQERILRIVDDYKGLNKKQKLKYATIGKKNLLKMINQVYTEKFQLGKYSKLILLEILYDFTKIKYGNDGIIDKKLYRVFSSCIFHAPSSKRIALFAKFLMLGKRNFSNEILQFYLNAIFIIKNKNFNTQLTRNMNDEESVGIGRAFDSFKELFEKVIPLEIFPVLRKKVESLQVRDEPSSQLSVNTVDVDKYLDYCTNVYLRFHLNFQNRLQVVFNSWTLYSENFLTSEQLYCTLRALMGTDKVGFTNTKDGEVLEERTCSEIMGSLRERLGSYKGTIQMRFDQFQEVFQNSDLCHSEYAQKEFFDQIIFFEDQEEFKKRFDKMVKDAHFEMRSLFFGLRQTARKVEGLESEQVWYERIVRIENNYNVIHPSLLYLALLIMRKCFSIFSGKKPDSSQKKRVNIDLEVVKNT